MPSRSGNNASITIRGSRDHRPAKFVSASKDLTTALEGAFALIVERERRAFIQHLNGWRMSAIVRDAKKFPSVPLPCCGSVDL